MDAFVDLFIKINRDLSYDTPTSSYIIFESIINDIVRSILCTMMTKLVSDGNSVLTDQYWNDSDFGTNIYYSIFKKSYEKVECDDVNARGFQIYLHERCREVKRNSRFSEIRITNIIKLMISDLLFNMLDDMRTSKKDIFKVNDRIINRIKYVVECMNDKTIPELNYIDDEYDSSYSSDSGS